MSESIFVCRKCSRQLTIIYPETNAFCGKCGTSYFATWDFDFVDKIRYISKVHMYPQMVEKID